MTLTELLENYYEIDRIVSDGYAASIKNAIRNFQRYKQTAAATVEDLSDDELRGMATWMLKQKRSRATVNKNLRTLSALARFAYRRKLSAYRPDVEKLPERRPHPISWRPEELTKLINAIRCVFSDSWWGKTLLSVVLVAYDTALRLVDVLRIESNPQDFARGVVYVTERKTDRRRSYILHATTLKALHAAYGVFQGGRVFSYPYRETQPLRRRLRRCLAAAGLPTDRKCLFQMIRRTTANAARSAGMDASTVLGHSARWVTESYYLDPDAAAPMDVANQIARP
jgi:integrase